MQKPRRKIRATLSLPTTVKAPSLDEMATALRERTEAWVAEEAARQRKAPVSERVKLARRAEEATTRFAELQRLNREAFAAPRKLRFVASVSHHHEDAYCAADDRLRSPEIIVTVVSGYSNDGQRKPSGAHVEELPYSPCHPGMPGSWCVAVWHRSKP